METSGHSLPAVSLRPPDPGRLHPGPDPTNPSRSAHPRRIGGKAPGRDITTLDPQPPPALDLFRSATHTGQVVEWVEPAMRRLVAGSVALSVSMVMLALWANGASAKPQPDISYCHRTDAVSNPYVLHTSNADSIINEGHGSHTGPVFPGTGPDGKWGDIIAPFDYTGGHFDGLNWTGEGQDVLNAGCRVEITPEPEPPPTTTTTTPPASTTTSVPPTTTTTVPSTTTIPSSPTTSTTIPGTPPITSPDPGPTPPVDPQPPSVETLPPETAVAIDPGDQTVVLGPLSPAENTELEAELDQGGLAVTGAAFIGVLTVAGLLLLFAGSTLIAWWRRAQTKGY